MKIASPCKLFALIVLIVVIVGVCQCSSSTNNPSDNVPDETKPASSSSTENQQESKENNQSGSFWSLSLKNKLLKYANSVQLGVQRVLSSPLVEKIKIKSKKLSEHSKDLFKSLKNKSKQALDKSKDLVKKQYTKLKHSKPAQKIKKLSKKALRKVMDVLDLVPPSEKNSQFNDDEEEDNSRVSSPAMAVAN